MDNRPLAARAADRDSIRVHTLGGHAVDRRASAGPGAIDGLVWGVVQTGEWGVQDHAAWAYAVEAGYQLPRLPAAPWLRVGYEPLVRRRRPDRRRPRHVLPGPADRAHLRAAPVLQPDEQPGRVRPADPAQPHARVTVRTDYHWLRVTERDDLWYSGGGATNDDIFGFSGSPAGGHRELAHLVDVSVTVSLLRSS